MIKSWRCTNGFAGLFYYLFHYEKSKMTEYGVDEFMNELKINPAGNYMFKVNNRNTRNTFKVWNMLKVINKVIRNFEHIWHLVLVFLLLTLSM